MNKDPKNPKKDAEKSEDYKSYLHPSAHDYLPKEDGMVKDVDDKEKGTFDTSELEGDSEKPD